MTWVRIASHTAACRVQDGENQRKGREDGRGVQRWQTNSRQGAGRGEEVMGLVLVFTNIVIGPISSVIIALATYKAIAYKNSDVNVVSMKMTY